MYAAGGIMIQGNTFFQSGGTVAADNGVSIDPISGDVVLGDSDNGVDNNAQLLDSRIIRMLDNILALDMNNGVSHALLSFNNNVGMLQIANDMTSPAAGVGTTLLTVNGAATFEAVTQMDTTGRLINSVFDGNAVPTGANTFNWFFADLVRGNVEIFRLEPQGNADIIKLAPGAGLTGLRLLNFGGGERASFKYDEASGEIQHFAAGGGYFPTFWSNGAEAMRIDISGAVLIGDTVANGVKLQVNGNMSLLTDVTAVLDFPNTAAQTSSDISSALFLGALPGDVVLLGVDPGSVLPDSCFTAWVSAADTVTFRFNNYSAAAQDPPSGNFKVSVIKMT